MTEISCDIRKIADLLKVENENSDSEDDRPSVGMSKIGPGDIGKCSAHTVSFNRSTSGNISNDGVSTDPDAIWLTSEVINQPSGEEYFDPREQPEYEIKYSQVVGPEDVFLQMSGKTTLTSSCENMIVTIQLKGESKKAIDLSITETALDIRSPLYRLHLPLPHRVDPERGHAEWDGTEEVLSVRVHMVREYDFINF